VLLLLPPSETKRDGGADDSRLELGELSAPALTPQRTAALAALAALSRGVADSMTALRLGPTQRFEVDRNRAVASSPVMPALERYTGVLYDALDADTLAPDARAFAHGRVAIHSALFGLLDADDPIPAYRLSHDSRLPRLRLGELWRAPLAAEIASHSGLIVDLRSEAYANLGPAPEREDSVFLRVVTEGAGGVVRALNHFNKKGKGLFVRRLLASGVEHGTAHSLLDWAAGAGIRLERGKPGELALFV
jgi:hypothetical protein